MVNSSAEMVASLSCSYIGWELSHIRGGMDGRWKRSFDQRCRFVQQCNRDMVDSSAERGAEFFGCYIGWQRCDICRGFWLEWKKNDESEPRRPKGLVP
jgi:hypothetical protein